MANELVTTVLETHLTLKDAEFKRKFKEAINEGAASAEGLSRRANKAATDIFDKFMDGADKTKKKYVSMFTILADLAGNFGWKLAKAFAFGAVTLPVGLAYGITKLNADLAKTASFAEGIGLTVNQFKQFQAALTGTGVQAEKAMYFTQEWAKRSGELQLGIGTISVTLNKLGIDVKQFQGLNPIQMMEKLIEATSHLSKQQQIKIFDVAGIGSNTLISMLKNFKGSLAEVRREWTALGLNLDPGQIAEARRFTKEVAVLKTVFDNLLTQIAANSAGPLADLVKSITEKIKESGGIKAAAFKISESILTGIGHFLDAMSKLAKILEGILPALKQQSWGEFLKGPLVNPITAVQRTINGPGNVDRSLSTSIEKASKRFFNMASDQGVRAKQVPWQSIATSGIEGIRGEFDFSGKTAELATDRAEIESKIFKVQHAVAKMVDKFSDTFLKSIDKIMTSAGDAATKGAKAIAKSISDIGEQMQQDAKKLLNPHSNLAEAADESYDSITGEQIPQAKPSDYFREGVQEFLRDVKGGGLSREDIEERLNSLQDDAEMEGGYNAHRVKTGEKDYYGKEIEKLEYREESNAGALGAVEELREKFLNKMPTASVNISITPSKEFEGDLKLLAADGVDIRFEKEARQVAR